MLKRLYVHNYKAFQNFEIKFDELGSFLCLGKNGVGKSSLVEIFKFFQKIGEGQSQVSALIDNEKFNFLQPESPMQLDLEIELSEDTFKYILLIDSPSGFSACRVIKEQLSINDVNVLDRNEGDVLYKSRDNKEIADFFLDWHMIALPIFNPRRQELESIQKFKRWLENIVVLSPVPALMENGKQEKLSVKPNYFADNLNSWITRLFSEKPRSYQYIYEYLNSIFPDLEQIDNEEQLGFIFISKNNKKKLTLSQLSYGERIFILWSSILASVRLDQISICVWDEPDNYISLLEIQYYFNALKKVFKDKALFIATTHNPETMREFSSDNIFILSRENHLAPVRLQYFSELDVKYDIAESIKSGLVEL